MEKSSRILSNELLGSQVVKNEFTDEHLEVVNFFSKIYLYIKKNWWGVILFLIAGIYILYRIIFIPISISKNDIEYLKEAVHNNSTKLDKLEEDSKIISVNQANIFSIEHRIEELKIQNKLSLRIYTLEKER